MSGWQGAGTRDARENSLTAALRADLDAARARTARLEGLIEGAVAELDAEHYPQWANPGDRAEGRKPLGCVICWPRDGSWPCSSRAVADDLRRIVHPEPEEETADAGPTFRPTQPGDVEHPDGA